MKKPEEPEDHRVSDRVRKENKPYTGAARDELRRVRNVLRMYTFGKHRKGKNIDDIL